MRIDELSTPALLLDEGRMRANIGRMNSKARGLGVNLRPHLKTAKSAAVATIATENHQYGIAVSTLREAEYFAEHGFKDILYAVGIVPSKLAQAAALMEMDVDLKVVTDNVAVARAIAAHGAPFKVLVEIDCGDRRAGVQADGDELLAIAMAFKPPTTARLLGLMTHAGHSYAAGTISAVAAVAEEERTAISLAATRLRDVGHEIEIVSAGSTPTALHMPKAQGLTELRAGVYVFFDLDQQSRGVCDRSDIALSVLASVIGHNRAAGKILLDSGGLALSKDTSATAFRPEVGYGEVCTVDDDQAATGLYVTAVSQEHGHVAVTDESAYERFPIGSQVRVLPNHACMTAAAYDCYHVVQGGTVVERWDRTNGW
ncbi:MAG: hypothetical protein HOI95_09600 [Chromatiales bacterium]|nr:hypothetical protein [Chromatiales bacterium]